VNLEPNDRIRVMRDPHPTTQPNSVP
jgi:hypothetical protein